MKAAVYNKYGGPEFVQVKEVPKPSPKPNEVLVKIHATTVTRGDSRIRSFIVPSAMNWILGRMFLGIFRPRRKILGMELAGEIAETGDKVTEFKVGDKVFASTYPGFMFGSHAEYVCLPESGMIALKPSNMSYEEAAPVASGGAACLVFLRDIGKVGERGKVLINGASGTLGTFGVQIAKYYGAEVTGVCSTRNVDRVKSLGADHVIDYTKDDFTKGEEKYDLIFDAVSKSSKEKCSKILTPTGSYIQTGGPEPNRDELVFLRGLIEDGYIKTVIDRRYSLDDIVEAHRYVDTGRKQGNVVINIIPEELE